MFICDTLAVQVIYMTVQSFFLYKFDSIFLSKNVFEPRHEISNNVVCATSKASDQPAHTRSLIRAFASRLNILRFFSYCLNIIYLGFLSLKEAVHARLSLHMSKCHNVRNPMPGLIFSLSSLMVVLDIQYSADGLDIPINRTAFTVDTPLLSVY